MISPIIIKPEQQNNKAKHIFFACLGSAIISIALYTMLPQYNGIVGIVALGFITAAIYLYNRYLCAAYYYEVTMDSSGSPIFVISQTVGKRQTTLCRVDLSSIILVKAMSIEERKSYKPASDVARYFYSPTLSPERVYLLEVRSPYEKADVFVELTDEQAAIISAYAKEARENYTE